MKGQDMEREKLELIKKLTDCIEDMTKEELNSLAGSLRRAEVKAEPMRRAMVAYIDTVSNRR